MTNKEQQTENQVEKKEKKLKKYFDVDGPVF